MKEYSLVIASNFLDHYMQAQSIELMKYFKDFHFVASEKLEEKYQKLGFSDLNNSDIVIKAYENKEKAKQIILNADIVITGSYKYQEHIKQRLNENKIVLFYSERLFKNNNIIGKALRYIKYNVRHAKDDKSILLCVSAYAASDYNSIGLFKNKTYKWGYFPKTIQYKNINELVKNKTQNSIIWVGRLVKWKHPDVVIEIAKKLKENNIDFNIKMIGNGEMKEELIERINSYKLNKEITLFADGMSPEDVRKNMEEAQIYMFTSDYGEGWGVVLNEAMNSGCACIASKAAGSSPYLIKDGINGYLYDYSDINDLFIKTKELLINKEKQNNFSINAYNTITNEWNAEIAASRLYDFINGMLNNDDVEHLFLKGILSKDN